MTDTPGSDSTTGTKRFGMTVLLSYLIVVIIFQALFFALLYGWKLLLMLLMVIHVPPIILKGIWLLAVLSSLAGSFTLCRKVWRGRPKS
jgi:hypothetical protein